MAISNYTAALTASYISGHFFSVHPVSAHLLHSDNPVRTVALLNDTTLDI